MDIQVKQSRIGPSRGVSKNGCGALIAIPSCQQSAINTGYGTTSIPRSDVVSYMNITKVHIHWETYSVA